MENGEGRYRPALSMRLDLKNEVRMAAVLLLFGSDDWSPACGLLPCMPCLHDLDDGATLFRSPQASDWTMIC
jgi:hypothetical protein